MVKKIVLRLLDMATKTFSLNNLGLNDLQKEQLMYALEKPQGLILVTGPTGSGKTMTLYAALAKLNTLEKNIVTAEEPVEIKLAGINQVPIYPKIGLTFTKTLRALLRQDPDIMMIGEIRDVETAEIAINAAQTGHLVLATLHTNNAVDSLTRLLSMGIAPYHLASSLSLIIAQRLVRCICQQCASNEGCPACHQGFKGRTGLFEVLPVTQTLANLILAKADGPNPPVACKTRRHVNLARIRLGKS